MKQLKPKQRISLFLTLGILLSLLRAPLFPAEEAGWALPAETEEEWVIPEETEGEILPEEMAPDDLSAAEGADPFEGLIEDPDLTEDAASYAEDEAAISAEGHCLAFASDLHAQNGKFVTAMRLFPQSIEYISLIGDLVGDMSERIDGRPDMHPAYDSSDIFDLIRSVFTGIPSDRTSIIWATHDRSVNDNAGIVKCMEGYSSGPVYTGLNDDGSPAYYIYGIGFYHMSSGGDVSRSAARDFKDWVRALDGNVPVIVLCHMPLMAQRADNNGAEYWNEALNFAATGVEGISASDPEVRYPVIRNVVYLYGHNHSVDKKEYVFRAGTTMNVQVDASADPVPVPTEPSGGEAPRRPRREAKGVLSDIYYTACIPGYLKESGNALLLRVTGNAISLEKYNDGAAVSLGMDGQSDTPLPASLQIGRVRYGTPRYEWSDDCSMVTAVVTDKNSGSTVTETVHTTARVTKAAGCTGTGQAEHTAVFSNPVFRTQTSSSVLPAAGHTFPAWRYAKAPTALKDGRWERTCSVCGFTEAMSVPRLKAKVTLNRKKLVMEKGMKFKLRIRTKTPGDKILKWKSSKKKVASVNKKGVVRAKKRGKCTITLYMKSGAKVKCKVTVG